MSVATKTRWFASMLAGGVCFAAGAALSQAAVFPVVLTTFQPNTPAVATQVNANFAALKNAVETVKAALETKVGPISNAGAVLKSTSASSLYVAGDESVAGGLSVKGSTGLANTTLTGTLGVSGRLDVQGPTTLRGDTGVVGNLTVSGEVISSQRYVLAAPYNPSFPAVNTTTASVPVDQTRLEQLCGDEDGCTATLVMKDPTGTRQDPSMLPVHFEYDIGTRYFRGSEVSFPSGAFLSTIDPNAADGNGAVNHALRAYNCYLTDSNWAPGSGNNDNDNSVGMYLLNYNNDTSQKPRCLLIIDD